MPEDVSTVAARQCQRVDGNRRDMPFNGTNATIPITSSEYNQTNGTFCVTSVLTEVSAYLGANLTNPFVDTLVLGGNSTALNLLGMIPHTALCSDCIYAGVDLIEEQYPQLGSISIAGNMTVNQYLDGVCNATGLQMTMSQSHRFLRRLHADAKQTVPFHPALRRSP